MLFNRNKNTSWSSRKMDDLRLHLSHPDALLQLAFLGIISGFITGGIIVLFRVFVEGSQAALLQSYAENYEILSLQL